MDKYINENKVALMLKNCQQTSALLNALYKFLFTSAPPPQIKKKNLGRSGRAHIKDVLLLLLCWGEIDQENVDNVNRLCREAFEGKKCYL